MSTSKMVPLAGSERHKLTGATSIGPTDPHQLVEISVVLKHRQHPPAAPTMDQNNGRFLTHADFANNYGADPAQIDQVREFAKANNLQVLERGDEVLRRTIILAGSASAMEKAFQVELNEYEHEDGSYRGRTGAIHIPENLAGFVEGIFGLDDRPMALPHFRHRTVSSAFGIRATTTSFTPAQLAHLYGFPTDATGAGQNIGIIELGGGYRLADIRQYFHSLGLPVPKVKSVSVDHGKNRPSSAQSADGEVMLDIEVAAAVAPGVAVTVYFAPNTSRGFQDALSTAIHDQLHKPSAVSISWGSAEQNWTRQSLQAFDQVAQDAAALGITITVASGDSGSSDGVHDGQNHVDFPASSPHVLACGGTKLIASNGSIADETVWNDGSQGGATGGGYSAFFPPPEWQASVVSHQGRGVPDVAGDADPQTGYSVLVDGQSLVFGGTSAVAPLWAGLVAVLNQKLGRRLGYLNPILYTMNQSAGFRDIITGNNGAFTAQPGWDAATGLGSPMAGRLLQALGGPAPLPPSQQQAQPQYQERDRIDS